MHVVDYLVRDAAVVLQDVEVLGTGGERNLFRDGEQLRERFVGDVGQLGAVVLGDYEGVAVGLCFV